MASANGAAGAGAKRRLSWAAAVASSILGMACLVLLLAQPAAAQSSVRPPDNAVTNAAPTTPPADSRATLPPSAGGKVTNPSAILWGDLRRGAQGTVSIPDKKAGQLIQSEGELWRNQRNGALTRNGAWFLLLTVVALVTFFLLRGRIRIEHGWAGRTITRFGTLERMGHWLLAVSFIILALSGLNLLYGRYILLPLMGPKAFASMTMTGKLLHNYVAFAFMAGLVLVFVNWVRHNLPSRYDAMWILKGGGILVPGTHPPARKFNFGQKVIFWLTILGGVSISLSGIALMFPFETTMFAKTFALINSAFGSKLPTTLSPLQEMQYAALWHGIVAIFLTCVILAHIYIGTIGMQGAFSAMGSGEVDLNWAREHHSKWVEEIEAKGKEGGAPPAPAAKPVPAE